MERPPLFHARTAKGMLILLAICTTLGCQSLRYNADCQSPGSLPTLSHPNSLPPSIPTPAPDAQESENLKPAPAVPDDAAPESTAGEQQAPAQPPAGTASDAHAHSELESNLQSQPIGVQTSSPILPAIRERLAIRDRLRMPMLASHPHEPELVVEEVMIEEPMEYQEASEPLIPPSPRFHPVPTHDVFRRESTVSPSNAPYRPIHLIPGSAAKEQEELPVPEVTRRHRYYR